LPESTKSSQPDPSLWAVILAGGVGSRFWPVSTPERPKQLLALGPGPSLISDTIERILPLVSPERIRILSGEQLGRALLSQVPALNAGNLLVEPAARGTGPVLAWAAAKIAQIDPAAVMASLHSDHVIAQPSVFRTQLLAAAKHAATHHTLVTLGVPPTRPETGYGYIRAGERVPDTIEAYRVARFVEKPSRELASDYVRQGYLWNSGIFVWPVATLLEQIRACAPEIAEHLSLIEEGRDAEFFARVPSSSIDEAVLERSQRVTVVPAHFTWDDVGAWDAVGRTRPADANGNVMVGSVSAVDATDNIAWADEGAIVLFGVEDLVVVRTGNVTLVAARERTADLKSLLNNLPAALRELKSDD